MRMQRPRAAFPLPVLPGQNAWRQGNGRRGRGAEAAGWRCAGRRAGIKAASSWGCHAEAMTRLGMTKEELVAGRQNCCDWWEQET